MNTKLITALRLCASSLLGNSFPYNWHRAETCNCGVLVCTLNDISPVSLARQFVDHARSQARKLASPDARFSPTWRVLLGTTCPVTGFAVGGIFTALKDAGLTRKDMDELEYLRNPEIRKRMPLRDGEKVRVYPKWMFWAKRMKTVPAKIDHANRIDVANYMRAWADILTEEGQVDPAPARAPKESIK